jgi:hypothetical protein
VLDALSPLGITSSMLPMPLTPERIWRAIHTTRGAP